MASHTPPSLWGGDFLNSGSYGCAFTPSVRDASGAPPSAAQIGKLMQDPYAQEEYAKSRPFADADPQGRFGVYPLAPSAVALDTLIDDAGGVVQVAECALRKVEGVSDSMFAVLRNEAPKDALVQLRAARGVSDGAGALEATLSEALSLFAGGPTPLVAYVLAAAATHVMAAMTNLLDGLVAYHARRGGATYHLDIKWLNVVATVRVPVARVPHVRAPLSFKFIDFGLGTQDPAASEMAAGSAAAYLRDPGTTLPQLSADYPPYSVLGRVYYDFVVGSMRRKAAAAAAGGAGEDSTPSPPLSTSPFRYATPGGSVVEAEYALPPSLTLRKLLCDDPLAYPGQQAAAQVAAAPIQRQRLNGVRESQVLFGRRGPVPSGSPSIESVTAAFRALEARSTATFEIFSFPTSSVAGPPPRLSVAEAARFMRAHGPDGNAGVDAPADAVRVALLRGTDMHSIGTMLAELTNRFSMTWMAEKGHYNVPYEVTRRLVEDLRGMTLSYSAAAAAWREMVATWEAALRAAEARNPDLPKQAAAATPPPPLDAAAAAQAAAQPQAKRPRKRARA